MAYCVADVLPFRGRKLKPIDRGVKKPLEVLLCFRGWFSRSRTVRRGACPVTLAGVSCGIQRTHRAASIGHLAALSLAPHGQSQDRRSDRRGSQPSRDRGQICGCGFSDAFKHVKWFANDGPGEGRNVTRLVLYLGREKLTFSNGNFALSLISLWTT